MTKNKSLDPKLVEVEAYHAIMSTAEDFSRISPNISKQLLEVTQHTHGYLNSISSKILLAGNEYNIQTKINLLLQSKNEIFMVYGNLSYLVRVRSISIGACNNVISKLKQCYDQINPWLTYLNKHLNEGEVTLDKN